MTHKIITLLSFCLVASLTTSKPISVSFGTNTGSIIPPTPRSTTLNPLAPKQPAPVHENIDDDVPNPINYRPPTPNQYRTSLFPSKGNSNLIRGTPLDAKYTSTSAKHDLFDKKAKAFGLDYGGPQYFELQDYEVERELKKIKKTKKYDYWHNSKRQQYQQKVQKNSNYEQLFEPTYHGKRHLEINDQRHYISNNHKKNSQPLHVKTQDDNQNIYYPTGSSDEKYAITSESNYVQRNVQNYQSQSQENNRQLSQPSLTQELPKANNYQEFRQINNTNYKSKGYEVHEENQDYPSYQYQHNSNKESYNRVPVIGVIYSSGLRYYVPQVYANNGKELENGENSVYDRDDNKYVYNN